MSHDKVAVPAPEKKPSATELAWAGGIFVGEGHVSTERRKTPYLIFAISMNDHRSVMRFAETIAYFIPERYNWKSLGQSVSVTFPTYSGKVCARIHLGGRSAEGACRALWPWLEGTDKGDQCEAAFDRAGLPHPSEKTTSRKRG